MRFALVPYEYQSKARYTHCNTKRTWQIFLTNHFKEELNTKEIRYDRTVANAALRIAGLEIKIGMLLADHEQRKYGEHILSGTIRPSIVIDCVLSIFSILEGLGTLSYLSSASPNLENARTQDSSRYRKWEDGVKERISRPIDDVLSKLRMLRDRCIHQDRADLKDDHDYEYIFEIAAISEIIAILNDFLLSLSSEKNPIPQTNFGEFSEIRILPAPK
jgi:hypothetical protein